MKTAILIYLRIAAMKKDRKGNDCLCVGQWKKRNLKRGETETIDNIILQCCQEKVKQKYGILR